MPTVDPKTQFVRAFVSVPPSPPDTGNTLTLDSLTDLEFLKAISGLTPPFKAICHAPSSIDPGQDWETMLVSSFTSGTRAGTVVVTSVQDGFKGQGVASVVETTQGGPSEAVNEQQQLAVTAAGGTYTLTFGGQTTPALAWNAADADIASALNNLSSIGGAGGSVSVLNGLVTFGDALAAANQALITASSSLTADVTILEEQAGDSVALLNEQQSITVNGAGGTYTLTLGAATSAAIAYNAAAATVQSAIQGMSTVGSGNATVTGAYPLYLVEFTGALANTNVASMTANVGSLTAAVAVTAVVDGSPGSVSTNEVQTLTIDNVSGGTFTLTFGGQTTAARAYNVATATLQTALQGLSSVGAGNLLVTGAYPTYTLTFAGALANTNVALVTGDSSLLTALGQSEVQTVHIDGDGGTFKLSLDGVNYTTAQAYNVAAATLQSALEGLSAIGVGNVLVEDGLPTYRLTFQGALAQTDVAQITGDATALTQSAHNLTVARAVDNSSPPRSILVGDAVECAVLPDWSQLSLTLADSTQYDNFAPSGMASASALVISAPGPSSNYVTLSGLTGGVQGRRMIIHCDRASGDSVQLLHVSTASAAGNRFYLSAGRTLTLVPGAQVEMIYIQAADTSLRWQQCGPVLGTDATEVAYFVLNDSAQGKLDFNALG